MLFGTVFVKRLSNKQDLIWGGESYKLRTLFEAFFCLRNNDDL